ncbi:hypothetical protein P8452_50687 [Trifolium repens]|nr:hypothetical protein P8452_50687 [Trifolium repens]
MKDTLVLYPALGKGHLNSMIELGKLILTHYPSFSISILILSQPNTTMQPQQEIQKFATTFGCESFPAITFHHIPPISIPVTLPPHLHPLEVCGRSNHHVNHIFQSISKTSNLKGVILDFMNYSTNQITSTLDIPTYFYYTSGASTVAIFLQLPIIHQNTTKSLKDFNMHPHIPGLPQIPIADMPEEVKDREGKGYKVFLDMATSMMESDGVIVNTFDAIESRVIKAFKAGLCLPDGTTPPLYCIGPMISLPSMGENESDNLCLSWLDSQPSKSVVFLCFGKQKMNRSIMIEEMKVALKLNKSNMFVSGAELGDRVKELMESERGIEIKERILKMKISAKEAKGGGGSSLIDLKRLGDSWGKHASWNSHETSLSDITYEKKLTYYDITTGFLVLPYEDFGEKVFDKKAKSIFLVDDCGNK